MSGKKEIPAAEAERLLRELREYMQSPKTAPLPPVSRPERVRYSLREDIPGFPLQPGNTPPLDESEVRDLYLDWERKNGLRKSFGTEVNRMVDRMYSRPSLFYRAVGMDKRTFHKIRTDYGYRPSRKTAFQCCIGLRLDVRSAEDLLQLAGYAFSPSEPLDLIIRFCLEKKIRDLDTINFLLSSFDLEDLDE